MYLVKSEVKKYFRSHGKQLSGNALQALNDAFSVMLGRVVRNAGHFKRVQEGEVIHALSGTHFEISPKEYGGRRVRPPVKNGVVGDVKPI